METIPLGEGRAGFLGEGTLGPDTEDGIGVCSTVKLSKGRDVEHSMGGRAKTEKDWQG